MIPLGFGRPIVRLLKEFFFTEEQLLAADVFVGVLLLLRARAPPRNTGTRLGSLDESIDMSSKSGWALSMER